MVYSQQPAVVPQGFDVFGPWFSEVFELWKARWQVWVGQGVIYFCVAVLPNVITSLGMQFVRVTPPHFPRSGFTSELLGMMFLSYGISIFFAIIAVFLTPGMVLTALKQIRGEEITVGDLFSGFRYGLVHFGIAFLSGLGALLCCIGFFVTFPLLWLALPLYMDRRVGFGKALTLSFDTVKQNLWLYIFFALVSFLLSGIGGAACYVGMVATAPFLYIAQAVAYERTFNNPTPMNGPPYGQQPLPGVVPPPYAPMQPPPYTQAVYPQHPEDPYLRPPTVPPQDNTP